MCLTSWLLTIIISLWKWTNRYEQDQHARSRATQQLLLAVRWRLAHTWFGLDEAVVSRGHINLHSTVWRWRSFWLHLSSFFHQRKTLWLFFNSPTYKKVDFWVSFPTPTLWDCRSAQVQATVCFCWWWAGSDPDLGHFWLTHEHDTWLGSGKEELTTHVLLSGERTLSKTINAANLLRFVLWEIGVVLR